MNIIKISLLCFSILIIILSVGCGNKPPNVPEIVAEYSVDSTYTRATAGVWVSTTDPNKDGVFYIMDWGDGVIDTHPIPLIPDEEVEPFASGETVFVTHMYAKWSPPNDPLSKTFEIKAAAKDEKGNIQKNYSEPFTMRVIYNDEPEKPKIVMKNTKGAIETYQTFKGTAKDPDGDSISIRFKFDKLTDWSRPRPSEDTIYGYGNWSSSGTKKVWCVARDSKGSQSVSSETLNFEVIDEGYLLGTFHAIFVEEGEPETLGFQSSPALVNIGGIDKVFIGSEAGYAYIVNAQTMDDEVRKFHYREDPDDMYEWGNTPAVDNANQRWYIANDQGEFYALSFTGSELWRYPNLNSELTGSSFTDATFSGSFVYVATEDTFYALNASTGLKSWFFVSPGISFLAPPIVDASGNIIIGDDSGYVRKFNGTNGSEIWKNDLGGWAATSGAIDNVSGIIYYCINGASENYLYALNPETGDTLWSYSVGEEVTTSIAIDNQGYIYFGDDQGRIHAVKDGFSKSNYPITIYASGLTVSLSTPSFTQDNFFYVMTEEQHLFCINNNGIVEWETPLPSSDIAEEMEGSKREDELIPSPVIGTNGDIYVAGGADYYGLYKIQGRANGVQANSAWPTFRHDRQRTGKAGTATK